MAEVIASMTARPGIETPQVVLAWDLVPAARAWRNYMLRRDDSSWPVTTTDGLLVTQGAAADIPDGWGDRFAQEATIHFYSLFAEVLRRPESTRDASYRWSRLAGTISIWAPDADYVWVLTYERGMAVVRRYVRADELFDIKYALNLGEEARGLAWVGGYGADADLIALVTPTRYVEVTSSGASLREFSLTGLSGVPDVRDVCWEMAAGVRQSIAVLDGRGRRVIIYDSAGTIIETHRLDGAIYEPGDLTTVIWQETAAEFGVGHGRRIIYYDRAAAPVEIYDTRGADYAAIDCIAAAAIEGGGDSWVVSDGDWLLALSGETAKNAILAATGWTERYVVDGEIAGATTTFVLIRGTDLTSNVATGSAWDSEDLIAAGGARIDDESSVGLSQGAFAEFSSGVAGWVPTAATVEGWARLAPSLVGGDGVQTKVLVALEGSVAGNEIQLQLTTDGKVQAACQFNGTGVTVTAADAVADAEWHHYAVVIDRTGVGYVKLYADGVLVGENATGPWGWVGVVDTGHLGTDDAGAAAPASLRPTWLGSADEVRIVVAALPVLTPIYDWQLEQHAESRTGTGYRADVYGHRDDIFLRLLPPYVQTKDQSSELPLTGPTQMTGGEFAHLPTFVDGAERTLPSTATQRWWAMMGALLDRVHDEADNVPLARVPETAMDADIAFLQGHYSTDLDLQGLTDPEYTDVMPADSRARVLRSLVMLAQRKGSLDALGRIVRLLGFAILLSESFPRRQLDSTRDPAREDVPFDSPNWGFDSGAPTQPAAVVDVRFFRIRAPLVVGVNGETSIPATRQFTSVGAGFDGDCRAGDMIRLTGNGNEDAGDYLIETILSPDVVLVDRDWPAGSQVGVSYSVHIWVPPADPIASVLLRHMRAYKSWGTRLDMETSRP